MSTDLTEIQHSIIKEIAERNGFKQYSLEVYSSTSKGDNYLSQILSVTIEENNKKLELVVKKAPENEGFREAVAAPKMFYRETFLYDIVLRRFTEFQTETGLDTPFESFPKLHGSCDRKYSECLVLDNLIKKGYKHWNRKIPMNSQHVAFVMSEYGKLHATSFAIKKKLPELFEEISNVLIREERDSPNEEWMKDFIKNSCAGLKKAVVGNEVFEIVYQRLANDIEEYFFAVIKEEEDKMVVTHGDAWCNNMLFKYEDPIDTGKPTKVAIIDWQQSKIGLPLQDLVHFFYSCSSKEVMKDYKQYMKIYHDSLSHNLRKMSCNPEELFSFKDLERLWGRFSKYGLLIAGFVCRILFVDSQNAPDTQKDTTSTTDFLEQFDGLIDLPEVKNRVLDLFSHMVENKFI